MKAIIPTGGRGVRMQPMSLYTNKHFIPVANKPLIYYPVEAVAGAGIKEVAITYNPGGLDLAKEYLGDGSRWGLKFTYILQPEPKGVADIVRVAEEFMNGEPFVFHLGDNIFTEGIKPDVKYFLKNKPNAMVAILKHKENFRLGVPVFDKKGRLVTYLEKPEKPPNQYAIPGLYFFDKNVFKCFKGKDKIQPSERGEYEICSPFIWLINHGYKVEVREYKSKWMDPGKIADWIETNQYLLDKKVENRIGSRLGEDVSIKGRVEIGKNCLIKNSEIRGPVSILDGVTIIDSYIGPFTAMGNECIIESARIENCILMDRVRITKVKDQIDNSLIGPDSEIQGNDGRRNCYEFFVGERAKIRL